MLWDPFLYCINDSIQGNSETGNKVFTLPSEVSINNLNTNVRERPLEKLSHFPHFSIFPGSNSFYFLKYSRKIICIIHTALLPYFFDRQFCETK